MSPAERICHPLPTVASPKRRSQAWWLSRRLPRGDGGPRHRTVRPGQATGRGPPGAPKLMDGGCPWGMTAPRPPRLGRSPPRSRGGAMAGRAAARGEAQRGVGGSDKPPAPPGNSSCDAVSQSHPAPPPLAQNAPPPSPEALGWRDLQMPPGAGMGMGAVPWVGSPACREVPAPPPAPPAAPWEREAPAPGPAGGAERRGAVAQSRLLRPSGRREQGVILAMKLRIKRCQKPAGRRRWGGLRAFGAGPQEGAGGLGA